MFKDLYTDKIRQHHVTSSKSRVWTKRPYTGFIVAHDTGNPGSTAAGNRNWFQSEDKVSSSAHTFIDDKEILEILPMDEKAWHVLYDRPLDNQMFGDDANDIAIGVELCYGGNIDTVKAYEMYVWYIARLCKIYGLNPRSKVTGHFILDPGRKTDPVSALKTIGKTWNNFLSDLYVAYDQWDGTAAPTPAPAPGPKAPYAPEDLAGKQTPAGTAYIKVDKLNVRSAASMSGEVLRQLDEGETWNVYGSESGWLRIHDGFISAAADYVTYTKKGEAAPAPAPAASYPLPSGSYKRGDEGPEIIQIQKALDVLGFKIKTDFAPNFGPKTEDAVRRFQSVYLPEEAIGVYGPKTKAAIEEQLRKKGL